MIEIANDGGNIASTNYWRTDAARQGFCYLSGNAGVWRLLVPPAAEYLLPDMRTGQRASIERSVRRTDCIDIVFDDGTTQPFSLSLDRRHVDRALQVGPYRLTVWTDAGRQVDLPCDVQDTSP